MTFFRAGSHLQYGIAQHDPITKIAVPAVRTDEREKLVIGSKLYVNLADAV